MFYASWVPNLASAHAFACCILTHIPQVESWWANARARFHDSLSPSLFRACSQCWNSFVVRSLAVFNFRNEWRKFKQEFLGALEYATECCLYVCVCVGKSVFGVPLVMIYSMDQHSNRIQPQNDRQNETVRVREYQSIITWCICLAWLLWVVFHPRKLSFVNSQKETCLCSYPILLPHGRFVSLTLCTTLIFVQMACASGMFY